MTTNNQGAQSQPGNPNWRVFGIVTLFVAGLVTSGVLRHLHLSTDGSSALTGLSTEIYIVLTILTAVLLRRFAVPMRQLGFGPPFKTVNYLVLAVLGVGLIQLTGTLLEPLWAHAFGASRNLARFSDVSGSPIDLLKLMTLNWTLAAFGEELAFRIVLMRGVAYALGDSRKAFGAALIVQAVVFGLVHMYQGPAGVLGSAINGLIFGGLTLAARGSIWPAAVAHGANNSIGIMDMYWAG